MGQLLLIAAVATVCYLVSLRLHPWRACRSCKGAGRHKGSVFTYSSRGCTSCGGNGRRARLGVHVFHRRALVWGESKPAEATAKRGQNFGR
jgi:hypothetical protein